MSSALFVPLVLGVAAVLQAGLNRRIVSLWGLGTATLLNSAVLTGCAVLLIVTAHVNRGSLGTWLIDGASFRSMRWWWLVPGFSGLAIVTGLPWSIQRLGALTAFVTLVASQMVASLVWDQLAEGTSITPQRAIGAALAVLGALLAAWR